MAEWMGSSRKQIPLPEGGTYGDLLAEIRKIPGPRTPSQLSGKNQEEFGRALFALREGERLVDPAARLREGEEIHIFLALAGG